MPGGRPTKYTKRLIKKARLYLEEYKNLGHEVPSHIGLAVYLKISKTCMYDWAKEEDKKEFSDILDEITSQQFVDLTSRGLNGTFNATITKLMLTKHGLNDKVDTNHSGQIDLSTKSDAELQSILDS